MDNEVEEVQHKSPEQAVEEKAVAIGADNLKLDFSEGKAFPMSSGDEPCEEMFVEADNIVSPGRVFEMNLKDIEITEFIQRRFKVRQITNNLYLK